jgi:hypothetical protein
LELFGTGIPYDDWTDPNHRLFGTHYCGKGGGGTDVNQLDSLCHAHDNCYQKYNVSASANIPFTGVTLSPSQVTGIQGCNQALANGAKNLIGKEYGANSVYYWMKGYLGFVAQGTAAK